MKGATWAFHLVAVLVILIAMMSGRQQATAFVARTCQTTWSSKRASTTFLTAEKLVEVCGFKDCRARGGGQRLQKLVSEVRMPLADGSNYTPPISFVRSPFYPTRSDFSTMF